MCKCASLKGNTRTKGQTSVVESSLQTQSTTPLSNWLVGVGGGGGSTRSGMEQVQISNQPSCVICASMQQLWRCAKCKSVYYCSTAHQHMDWPTHKPSCRLLARQRNNNNSKMQQLEQAVAGTKLARQGTLNTTTTAATTTTPTVDSSMRMIFGTHETEIMNSKAESLTSNSNNYNYHGNVDANSTTMEQIQFMTEQQQQHQHTIEGKMQEQEQQYHHQQQQHINQNVIHNHSGIQQQTQQQQQHHYNGQNEKSVSCQIERNDENLIGDVNQRRYEDLCRNIITDMNQYGLSVVDDFLGMNKGLLVLNEVHRMYAAGVFQDGQLVNNTQQEQNLHRIRGDKITWVKGVEQGCSNVGYLINQIDAVICRANTMRENGKLGQYNIKERTKAMVACYPGSGSHYVMHVDNPNKDGRVITAIYYLNVNWDTRRSGGVLRIFPEPGNSVADIEPKFDRLIFFWSDKRNPHEVQPAHRTRYAITVWYFDADEREKALHRCRNEKAAQRHTERTIDQTTTSAISGGSRRPDNANEKSPDHLQCNEITNSSMNANERSTTHASTQNTSEICT